MEVLKLCSENGVKVIRQRAKYVEAERPDGLIVFLDVIDEKMPKVEADTLRILNAVRVMGKREDVIMAVGMVRGLQIARGYARRYSPESTAKITRALWAMIGGGSYKKTAKRYAAALSA